MQNQPSWNPHNQLFLPLASWDLVFGRCPRASRSYWRHFTSVYTRIGESLSVDTGNGITHGRAHEYNCVRCGRQLSGDAWSGVIESTLTRTGKSTSCLRFPSFLFVMIRLLYIKVNAIKSFRLSPSSSTKNIAWQVCYITGFAGALMLHWEIHITPPQAGMLIHIRDWIDSESDYRELRLRICELREQGKKNKAL